MKKITRCSWVGTDKPHYEQYHDEEWGISVHDDRKLFEFLILEGAQAGLNWETILKRRAGYKKAFCNFDPKKVSKLSDQDLEKLMFNAEIIRNRLKIFSTRKNALVFLEIQKEFGSFSAYLWGFINNRKIINKWKKLADAPTETKESQAISKDLKKRGMTFVGSTIIYAYMQATGLVNDHVIDCHCYKRCCKQ